MNDRELNIKRIQRQAIMGYLDKSLSMVGRLVVALIVLFFVANYVKTTNFISWFSTILISVVVLYWGARPMFMIALTRLKYK